jgi:hypothetical protein
MVRNASEKQHRPAEPLLTRHVFLDTQVYRALGHNPTHPALLTLKEQIEAHRVVLHTTDITLLEVRRQIHERVQTHRRELASIEKDFRRWREQAPKSTPKRLLEFDAEALSTELFKRFRMFLLVECQSEVHQALVAPEVIFAKYFDRKPPFDGENSKEFPDAFVLEALARWAKTQDDKVHVVTEDKAMTRAVEANPHLLALKTIHDVLTRAAADLGAEAQAIAESLLRHPAFETTLQRLLKTQMKEATYVYTGDLAEGEAYDGELLAIEAVGDCSVVSLNAHRISLILDVTAKVRVEVQFEDRDSAVYDREDDRWFGVENASTEIEDLIDVDVWVEVNRASGEVVDAKVLTGEIEVFGPSDYD